MKKIFALLLCLSIILAPAQTLNYAYPVNFITLNIEQQEVKTAYMDVPSSKPNSKPIFNGPGLMQSFEESFQIT